MLKKINAAQPENDWLKEEVLEEYVNSLPPREYDEEEEDNSEPVDTTDDDLPF